jgi:hypothetical protein
MMIRTQHNDVTSDIRSVVRSSERADMVRLGVSDTIGQNYRLAANLACTGMESLEISCQRCIAENAIRCDRCTLRSLIAFRCGDVARL